MLDRTAPPSGDAVWGQAPAVVHETSKPAAPGGDATGTAPAGVTRLGNYELVRPLGHGGMADIYLARRAGLGAFERHVAIKVLNPDRSDDPDARALFLDEARLTGLLNHQHIATVLEVGERDGVHFLAMEYVHGADLRDVMAAAARTKRSIPYVTSLTIVAAAASGLDHAHRRCGSDGRPLQLVHRDVSLSNIMVGHHGAVKVVDFGIASATISSATPLPRGIVRGKASYMSPEQVLGEPIDARTDVFSLGVVLYELTTGIRCFQGNNDYERMLAVSRGDYVPPRDVVADYPRALEHVVRIALAVERTERYQSAGALVEALEHCAIQCGWVGGAGAVLRLMRSLFGEVPEPWTIAAPAAQLPAVVGVAPRLAAHQDVTCPLPRRATRPTTLLTTPRRFPRGSLASIFVSPEDWRSDTSEIPTRGRQPLHAARVTHHAACGESADRPSEDDRTGETRGMNTRLRDTPRGCRTSLWSCAFV